MKIIKNSNRGSCICMKKNKRINILFKMCVSILIVLCLVSSNPAMNILNATDSSGYFVLNEPPYFGYMIPSNNSVDVSIFELALQVYIRDPEGDSFNWSIETSPDIGSSSGTHNPGDLQYYKHCLFYTILDFDTVYTWFVNATDVGSNITSRAVYTFTTESVPDPGSPPVFTNENPVDGATDVSVWLPEITINIEDPEGYLYDWSIMISSDNGKNSGSFDGNGDKFCSISNVLDYDTTYSWTVTASDIGGEVIENTYTFTTIESPTFYDDGSWPMYQHDQFNSGFSELTTSDTSNLMWTNKIEYSIESPTVVVDGKLYVGGYNSTLKQGEFFCFDALTGDQNWKTILGQGIIRSSPAVSEGLVYTSLSSGYSSTFYCLNSIDGSVNWTFTPDKYVDFSSSVVFNGRVYTGAGGNIAARAGRMYCLDAYDGSEYWFQNNMPISKYSPAVYDKKIYFSANDETGGIYCLNPKNGDKIWKQSSTDSSFGMPILLNDKVYVTTNYAFGPTPKSRFICYNYSDGEIQYKITMPETLLGNPSISYGIIYMSHRDDWTGIYRIYGIEPESGNEELVLQLDETCKIQSLLSIADYKIYFGSTDDKILCIDAFSGENLWNYTIDGGTTSSPAIAYGNVYVCSNNGSIYCFGDDYSNNPPNNPSVPSGPGSIGTYRTISYSSSASDPDGDQIKIRFDWDFDGDHNISDWTELDLEHGVMSHAWDIPGMYKVRAQARDEHGGTSDWSEPFTVTVVNLVPDLAATGNLKFDNIKPDSMVEGEFKVRNVGDNGSWLNWGVSSYPSGWGNNWSFSPCNGSGLKVEDGWFVIEVSFMVPDKEEAEFSGRISVVNCDNSSDSIDIDVVCTTSDDSNSLMSMFIRLLGRLSERFPRLFSLFPFFQNMIDQYSSDLS